MISPQGEVLTNWHIIQGAKRVAVVFQTEKGDETRKGLAFAAIPAKVDQRTDLALLQIQTPPPNLPVLSLGDLAQVQIGQDVHAVGHAAGEVWTSTTGEISEIRSGFQWKGIGEILHQGTVIQTVTPTDPGDTGGPLLNDRAEIIGVNSFQDRGENVGEILYAVAVDTIKEFLGQPAREILPPAPPQTLSRPASPEAPAPVASAPRPPVPPRSESLTSRPSPSAPAYRTEPYGNIVGVYVDAQVPPPDVWLISRESRQLPTYGVKGQAAATRLDTLVQRVDPRRQAFVYYFDTNCEGIIDLIGYSSTEDGAITHYDKPAQATQLASLAEELVAALIEGRGDPLSSGEDLSMKTRVVSL